MWINVCTLFDPSMLAASYSSCGNPCRSASKQYHGASVLCQKIGDKDCQKRRLLLGQPGTGTVTDAAYQAWV